MKKSRIVEYLLVLCLFAALCEFLYADYTGQRTNVILVVFFFIGAATFLIENRRIRMNELIKIIVSLWVLVWSINIQSVRYFLTLMSIFFWTKHKFKDLEKNIKMMTAIGVLMAFYQFLNGRTRVSGFYANSPTQLACTLYVFETYLFIKLTNHKMDKSTFALVTLSLITIFLTETRSVLLAASIVFAFYLMIILVNSSRIKSKRELFMLLIAVALPILAINSQTLMDFVHSRFHRTNGDASNFTRMYMYNTMIGLLKNNPKMLFIGGKGGFAHNLFGAAAGQYLPVHQDFLLIVVEYGIVGLSAVLLTFLWRKRTALYFFMVFGICSFHNAVLNPELMILIGITMADLERNGDRIIPFRRDKNEAGREKA